MGGCALICACTNSNTPLVRWERGFASNCCALDAREKKAASARFDDGAGLVESGREAPCDTRRSLARDDALARGA